MQIMVNRYCEEGHIHQAKTSALRLIVRDFLRKRNPIGPKKRFLNTGINCN